MRFLCISAQLPGHLDWGGYLATAAELVRRGHEVRWASGKEVAPLIAQAGVPFHPLAETGWRWPPPPPLQPTPELGAATVRRLRAERALDQWLDVARVTTAAAELIACGQNFSPDVVVSEVFASAAGIAAEKLGVPLVVAGWPALQPKIAAGDDDLVAEARSRLHRLLAHFTLQGANWTATGAPALLSPQLHLTYWSPGWYEGLSLLPQTVHVGGQAPPPSAPPPWPDLHPWVLVTLGTSFGNDPNFFINAAHAAVQLGCLPILALGGQLPAAAVQTMKTRLPAQKIITDRVDFAGVLPNVAAAVHHGGAGTTHALITHTVPQIIVPHAADQMHQAQGVVRSGVGIHVPAREATIDRLAAALAQMLPDLSPYRAKTHALRDEFATLGGVPQAADLLEHAADYPPRSTG